MVVNSSSEHIHQDQIYLIFQNLFHSLVCGSLYYFFSILNLLAACIMNPCSFLVNFLQELWNLFLAVLEDGQKMFSLLKLNFILMIIAVKSTKNYILKEDKTENTEHALQVYKKIKAILNDFGLLPLSQPDSIMAYLILKKIPNFFWRNFIPFPSCLFEDTFAKSTEKDTILAELPPPEPATILLSKTKAPNNN